jgi:hypothetical protein
MSAESAIEKLQKIAREKRKCKGVSIDEGLKRNHNC